MKTGIKAFEKTTSNGVTLRVRRNEYRKWGTLVILCLSCVTASAPFAAVEFAGRITDSPFGWPVGERVIGYFTYEPGLSPSAQTSSRPNLVLQTPYNRGRYEYTAYGFYVYNNHRTEIPPFSGNFVYWDGLALEFCFMGCFVEGRGWLSLRSSNTGLFTNDLLPPRIPALEQFDVGASLSLTPGDIEEGATGIQIDRLFNVPQSELGRPIIHGFERDAAGISFRFLTEPSTGYTVEFKDSLTESNWLTLTNIASAREPIVTIKDAGSQQRFYRIRKG